MQRKLIVQHIHKILYDIVPKDLIDCIIKYVSFRVVDLKKVKDEDKLKDYWNTHYIGHIKNNLYFTYYSQYHESRRVIMLDVTKNKILHAPDNLQSICKEVRFFELFMYKDLVYIISKDNSHHSLKILDYNFNEQQSVNIIIDTAINNLIFYKDKIYAITSFCVYILNLNGQITKKIPTPYFHYYDITIYNNKMYLLSDGREIREYNCDTYEYKNIDTSKWKRMEAIFPFTPNNKYLSMNNKIIICDADFKEINIKKVNADIRIGFQGMHHINNYFLLISDKKIIKYIKLYELY